MNDLAWAAGSFAVVMLIGWVVARWMERKADWISDLLIEADDPSTWHARYVEGSHHDRT